ncbi:MAG: 2Fe-2S iron-sulfur cluster binding domain-containing protein [Deltaproteobacteria bacterium]|nr:2Fe-2S iron-sulfur cluster binding domain-containing protein [Deltaproteobacteria bacterium]
MATVKFLPSGRTVDVNAGTNVLKVAREVGLTTLDCCRLRPVCGACKISVIEGQDALNPLGDVERQYCKEQGYLPYQRLACLTKIAKDAEIWVEIEK